MSDSVETVEIFKPVDGEAAIDKPIRGVVPPGGGESKEKIDTLETFGYARALAEHVKVCGTPLTVGVQGEWGSGKTSLLNMMKEQIEEPLESAGRKGLAAVPGKNIYKTIWINTWEHSLLKTPEECLLSVISEIIDTISAVDGTWNSAQKAKSAMATLARGAVRIGATAALGSKGGQVADEILGDGNEEANSVKVLRSTLEQTISSIVNRTSDGNLIRKFVIFIDDLDRLEPSTAVMVLELLKNIFDLPHCVFVVAIDYHVVVKGLKGKFGEPTEENEWEFRAFFDKIIQLPFMMPVANYKLDNYIENLLEGVKYFTKTDLKGLSYFDGLIRMTVGYNPRSLKRLVNSLSLILKYYNALEDKTKGKEESDTEGQKMDTRLKQLVMAFVCIQISFPRIFELLRWKSTFYEWDDEFVNKITGGPHTENKDLAEHLNRAIEVNSEDFDTDWEKALFKIVWIKKWQRNKLVQASRVLSIIEEKILIRASGKGGENEGEGDDSENQQKKDDATDKAHARDLGMALQLTAVTAVASSDDTFVGDATGDTSKDSNVIGRFAYWQAFRANMQNVKTILPWTSVTSTHSSSSLGRKHPDFLEERIQILTRCTSTSVISIETFQGDPQENYEFFIWLKHHSDKYLGDVGVKPKYTVSENSVKQSISFPAPKGIAGGRKDLSRKDLEGDRGKFISWIAETLPLIEQKLLTAMEEFDAGESLEGSVTEIGGIQEDPASQEVVGDQEISGSTEGVTLPSTPVDEVPAQT